MAITPEKSLIELYNNLLEEEQEIDLQHSIWAFGPSLSDRDKKTLIEELEKLEKDDKEQDETEKRNKILKDLEIPTQKLNLEEYEKLLPLMKLSHAIENNGVPEEHAVKLILAFGTKDKAVEYLKRCERIKPDVRSLAHDACLFRVPSGEWNIEVWQALANKHMPNKSFEKYFGRGNEIEAYLKKDSKNLAEKIKEKILRRWEFSLGEEYEKSHLVVTEEEYIRTQLKKQDKMLEREINNRFDAQARSLYGVAARVKPSLEDAVKIKEYKESLQGKKELEKIRSEILSERAKKLQEEYQARYGVKGLNGNLEKRKYIEERLKQEEEKINQEIEQQKKLIFSEKTSLETFGEYYKHVCYKRTEENLLASTIFSDYEMSEQAFNTYLDLPKNDSDRIPPLMTKDNPIPILVDGKDLHPDYSGFYLTKLSPSDPRCAILGKCSSCCQHLDYYSGAQCAKHGIQSTEGGFYVLCQRQESRPASIEDPIVAQCWAWRSKNDGLVFDSVEMPVHYRNNQPKQVMIADFFTQWGHQLVTKHAVPQVLVGAGSNTPKNLGSLQLFESEQPSDYYEYRDSHKQRVIADKRIPFVKIYQDKEKNVSKLPDIKEIKEEEERRATVEEREAQKKAIFEFCDLCASNQETPALSYIIGQAEKLGISKSQLEERCSQTSRFLDLLRDPTDFKEITELLKQGVPASLRSGIGETVLTLAISEKVNAEVVEALLNAGAKSVINEKGLIGKPLFLAVEGGAAATVSVLLAGGAPVNEKDNYGNTALRLAVRNKDAATVSVLLAGGAPVNEKDQYGNTMLYQAVRNRDAATVSALMKEGADISTLDGNGETVLFKVRDVNIASNLLTAPGVKKTINMQNKDGFTALMMISMGDEPDIVKRFLEAGAGETINITSDNKMTALLLASKCGNVPIVKLLLEAGAERINVPDQYGDTPLSVAEKAGNEPLTVLLKEALEKLEKQKVEVKERADNSSPLIFSQKVDLRSSDILKEAQAFRDPRARNGAAFELFKAKIGLEVSDTIIEISAEQVKVQKAGGETESYNIQERYEKQIKTSSVSKPPN